ncbi:hypothetical protein P692DRAFT_20879781 [Suillus brevipes Sb2]|nr:hypothetical protein P692DRAFT_20879781 [Suillus brevipes Sb2]
MERRSHSHTAHRGENELGEREQEVTRILEIAQCGQEVTPTGGDTNVGNRSVLIDVEMFLQLCPSVQNSPETARLQEEIENIHNEGLARPVIQAAQPTEFATSWSHQLMALAQCNFQAYWRNVIALSSTASQLIRLLGLI